MASAAGGDVKLIGWAVSPYVIRPMIALKLARVEYKFVELPFWHQNELVVKFNPVYKKVPVLLHGGEPICESMIIVQYVDQTWAQTILPEDSYQRAIQRFWAVFVDDKFPWVIRMAVTRQSEEEKAEAIGKISEGLKLLEEAYEKHSKGKPFFGGDGIGYLDIALGSFLGWFRAAEEIGGIKLLDEEETPLLVGWAERFMAHGAVKEVMPETDKLVKFAKLVADSDWPQRAPSEESYWECLR